MSDGEFKFQHLETEDDVAQNLELMREVFGEHSRVDLQVKKWIDYHPTMTLKDFFVIKHHDRTVAGLCLIPSKWSIGGTPMKVAEMGCVATLPEYRRKGLQRRLVAEYHKRVAEEGYDLSAIEGIPYFYRQFGYEYAIPLQEETKISLDRIPNFNSHHAIRPLTNDDIPKAMELLARSQQKFYVHAIREESIWTMQERTRMAAEYEFDSYSVEENGETKAHLRTSTNPETKELFLREITDADQTTEQSILNFLKEKGRQHELQTLVAQTSYADAFTEYLVAIGAVQSLPPYAWQIRVTDYARMFRKMKPLFERRLAASAYRHLTERVSFNFYRFAVELTVEDGAIAAVERLEASEDNRIRVNPLVFTQLMLGHRSQGELEAVYPDVLVKPARKELVDVLFPKMPSHIHCAY